MMTPKVFSRVCGDHSRASDIMVRMRSSSRVLSRRVDLIDQDDLAEPGTQAKPCNVPQRLWGMSSQYGSKLVPWGHGPARNGGRTVINCRSPNVLLHAAVLIVNQGHRHAFVHIVACAFCRSCSLRCCSGVFSLRVRYL